MAWLHSSGGLVYHLRAWRHGENLWRPFHIQVRAWLASWKPESEHLVLVGPSGGYALDSAFLGRFSRITAMEPDPLARFILSRRFPHIPFRWDPDGGVAQVDGFCRLADRHPHAAFLFCNLLGQRLVGQGDTFDRQAWFSGFEAGLAGRDWASWHDLASTQRPPDRRDALHVENGQPLDQVLGHFWRVGELSIHDHESGGLAPMLPRSHALWELAPGRYHLVEYLAVP